MCRDRQAACHPLLPAAHDPRSNVYLAQPGSSKELFYVNDKLVLNPIELKAMDQLSIGDTKLMFVPLCSEKFHW